MKRFAFAFLLTTSTLCVSAQAATFYRHLPFKIEMNQNDKVIVNYDLSEKKAIHCTTNEHGLSIDFTYKGYDKSAHLPIILESYRIPAKANEELADVSGQFAVFTGKPLTSNVSYEVRCDYLDNK